MEEGGRLFNCAALLSGGRILGIVPKTFLPSTNEYYEKRWFASARDNISATHRVGGTEVPFGSDLLFRLSGFEDFVVGVEICEDLWAVEPPSGELALAGATVIANPSASDELLGKSEYRRELVRQQSARCLAAYLYAGSGPNESTTDIVFGGHSLICENGALLAETERFDFESNFALADIDLESLRNERIRSSSFASGRFAAAPRVVEFECGAFRGPGSRAALKRPLSKTPFVPLNPADRDRNCREIFSIQATGLAKRLRHTKAKSVVIGVSGGLDSTLALLVTRKAFEKLSLDPALIAAVTMPGFGTTERTRENAELLSRLLGTTPRRIPISESVLLHFRDIGHDPSRHDVTYENSQARERTQILMDIANQSGGFVVGTGDMSEAAMGWCTFNGDHMSMYNVNGGVPKTLVRYLVDWASRAEFTGEASSVLRDICDTPISPELLPPEPSGGVGQRTESIIGPYELHDFFLFQAVRHQFGPKKVLFLASKAFAESFTEEEIESWLGVFYRRFFASQFKRSVLPDGPKVGSVALSPRGDWRMPSDAEAALWLKELEEDAGEMK